MTMVGPEDREKLVDSFEETGMDRARARLIIDVAVKAAEDAVSTMINGCHRVGDPMGNISAQSLAVQLVAAECASRLTVMVAVSERHGLPTNTVKLA
jgi:hypothetical protein